MVRAGGVSPSLVPTRLCPDLKKLSPACYQLRPTHAVALKSSQLFVAENAVMLHKKYPNYNQEQSRLHCAIHR